MSNNELRKKVEEVLQEYGIDTKAYCLMLTEIDTLLQQQESKWVSVEDRLPEYYQMVLGYKEGVGIRMVWMAWSEKSGCIFTIQFTSDIFEITHWMPLPEKPSK